MGEKRGESGRNKSIKSKNDFKYRVLLTTNLSSTLQYNSTVKRKSHYNVPGRIRVFASWLRLKKE